MFFILNDTKSFMKPEYSIIQCSSLKNLYEWKMPHVLYEKKL